MASELQRAIRGTPGKYLLRPNEAAKAEVWKKFSLIFEHKSDGEDQEMKYFCACNKCKNVYYAYTAADGNSYGTKNMIDHSKLCAGLKVINK